MENLERVDMQPVTCGFCDAPMDHLLLSEREDHYLAHTYEEGSARERGGDGGVHALAQESGAQSGSGSQRQQYPYSEADSIAPPKRKFSPFSENVFWHASMSSAPPANITPGLIPILEEALNKLSVRKITKRAVLCNPATCHVATEIFDMGWGCGYRNFLMACTALYAQTSQPQYASLLQNPPQNERTDPKCVGGPGVRNLQGWIEHAWQLGYDPQGFQDLRGKLVGTRKWIGTAELWVAFSSRGIPCQLLDFPKPRTDSSSTAAERLLAWIVQHFDSGVHRLNSSNNALDSIRGGAAVSISERLPIVLQHKGHSRTIVGYEMSNSGGINLLIYDPPKRPPAQLRRAALATHYAAAAPEAGGRLAAPATTKHTLSPRRLYERTKIAFKKRDRGASPAGDEPGSKRVKSEDVLCDAAAPSASAGRNGGGSKGRDEGHGSGKLIVGGEHLEPLKTVNFFRTNISKLNKNDDYQILYFPLTDPLTEEEKLSRRVVTGEMIAA
ncbi:hypothetical protein BOTBODRAFT_36468 [Botryobasidium botryosum FD-172 SS1]|uniref:UFSP1/2/DUB catalytic domain-containing protein n=1 Tax=Botryobasidium botryosum (strain FD-172 SS1) TaxID=930990 RepID=A0A067MF16_BOTB1|nr:hypothetical protein BOTBODRAFT_36468 [Botryobasidium botryosum FD-172 SS1]